MREVEVVPMAKADEPRLGKLDILATFTTTGDLDQFVQALRPIGPAAKENAFTQVMNYFRGNRDVMSRVIETEVDVSVEKEDYILAGKVDLLLGAGQVVVGTTVEDGQLLAEVADDLRVPAA